jgi:hypothetical protein
MGTQVFPSTRDVLRHASEVALETREIQHESGSRNFVARHWREILSDDLGGFDAALTRN